MNLINKLLQTRGRQLVKNYEVEHINFKYSEAVLEIEKFFSEFIFTDISYNKNRHSLLINLYGTQISEALYISYYLQKSLKLSGDVCEFGCANGATSAYIANEIFLTHKKLYLFDSFRGLSKPTKEDKLLNDIFKLKSMKHYEGTMNYPIEEVKSRLHNVSFPLKRTVIVPGFIDNTIKDNLPKQICFAYIDFDLYKPTITTLKYIDKRLSKKGYIIIDDYGFFSEGVEKAVKEFMGGSNKYQLILPHKFAGHFCILEKGG